MSKSMFTDSEPFLPVGETQYPPHTCITHVREKVVDLKKDDLPYLDPKTFEVAPAVGRFTLKESLMRRPDGSVIVSRTIHPA